jgi:hypothetical protein
MAGMEGHFAAKRLAQRPGGAEPPGLAECAAEQPGHSPCGLA